MAHTHGTGEIRLPSPKPIVGLMAVIVGIVAVVALAAVAMLWPTHVPHGPNPYGGEGVSIVDGTVSGVSTFDCGNTGEGPNGVPVPKGDCAKVSATTKEGRATFKLDPTSYVGQPMKSGDRIRLVRIQPAGQYASYEFLDFKRGLPMALLAAIFAVVVTVVGRWRGFMALVGIAVTVTALLGFVVPSMLAGHSPVAVAVAGSTLIMIAVLYLAHGISVRTTAALFGTLFGIAFTAAAAVASASWTHITGVGSEDDHLLVGTAPSLHLGAVVAGAMVIAGLGVLNDVTVTQASAVWELRAADSRLHGPGLYRAAMRIGRDHIASSVYTLVFAYAGSAMTVMMLIVAYQPKLLQVATSEQLAQEIVRTLVGAIGLVLAVPVTTAIATALAPPVRD